MSGGIARGRLAEVSTQLACLALCPSCYRRFSHCRGLNLPSDKHFGREGFCAEPASVLCVLRIGSRRFPMPWARGVGFHQQYLRRTKKWHRPRLRKRIPVSRCDGLICLIRPPRASPRYLTCQPCQAGFVLRPTMAEALKDTERIS